MKKILFLLMTLLLLSCSKDENGLGNLIITLDEVTDHTAKISWSISGAEGAVFEITLNGNVLSNGTGANQFTFTDLQELREYNGVVFARTPDNGETFTPFSFRTLEDRYREGNFYVTGQQAMNDFNFTVVEGILSINGESITDLSGLSSLEEVGTIHILRTSLTNLEGLHNLKRFTEGEGHIRIFLNPELSDVSALSNLSGSINYLRVESNPNLLNLQPLGLAKDAVLSIENSPFTDLSQVSFDEDLGVLELKQLPNLNSLNGLEQVKRIDQLKIGSIPNLQALNGLSELEELGKIELNSLPVFSDLTGLNNISISERIRLFNLPVLTSLNGLQATTHLNELNFQRLPSLTSFNGLNNLQEIGLEVREIEPYFRTFSLRDLTITSLEGLDSLTKIRDINIWDCNALLNLDGAQLTENGTMESGRWIVINRNANLTDFCGLTDFVNNSEFDVFEIRNNQYNPSLAQLQSETNCRQ